MITRSGRFIVLALVAALAACTSSPSDGESSPPVGSTVAPPASTTVVAPSTAATVPGPFPTATFAAIREYPVSDELAAQFQAALEDAAAREEMADGGGMTATVMTADGTWSGAVGKADDARDLRVDDQFAIASITKSVVAAQVMSMVEAGEWVSTIRPLITFLRISSSTPTGRRFVIC